MTTMGVATLTRIGERPVESYAVRLVFLLIPAVYLPFAVAGGRAGALAWLSSLTFALMILLVRPLPVPGLRFVLPYLIYLMYGGLTLIWSPDPTFGLQTLVQQAIVAVMYLVAWRAFEDRDLLAWIAKISYWLLVGGVTLAVLSLLTPFDLPSPRPFSIALTAMFAVANIVERSKASAWAVGLLGIAACAALGSRMAAFTFIVFFLITPNLGVRPWMRWTLIAAMVPLFTWAVTTAPFQERFFHEQGGDLDDILTLSSNVDTSGRLDNWALISARCDESSVVGLGMAAGRGLSLEASGGHAGHPHNEFLRIYCETGYIGSVLHWLFFALIFVRAVSAERRTHHRYGGVDRLAVATATMSIGFLLYCLTDNVLFYTQHYMAPYAVVLGLFDRSMALRRRQWERKFVARTHEWPDLV
jgi:hypothetical protein